MIDRGGALIVAWLSGASAGCFGSDPPPIVPSAPTREPIAKVARPQVLGTTPFDYAALPVIDVSEEAGVARTRPDRLSSVAIDGKAPLALELTVGDTAIYTWPEGTISTSPNATSWATCTQSATQGSSVARADGIFLTTSTPANAEVVAAVGVIDYARCRFVASREARAFAPAIVPGTIYAVRECLSGCLLPVGSDRRREVITLFGPAATWTTSNHPDASELTRERRGPFSRVTLPVTRGASTSAALLVEPAALLSFQRRTEAPTSRDLTQYTVEIVWSEADVAPIATAYVASLPYADPEADSVARRQPTP